MLTLVFDRERETKNTVRFAERVGDEPPAVGTLYLQKHIVRQLDDPDVVTVTIFPGDEAAIGQELEPAGATSQP